MKYTERIMGPDREEEFAVLEGMEGKVREQRREIF